MLICSAAQCSCSLEKVVALRVENLEQIDLKHNALATAKKNPTSIPRSFLRLHSILFFPEDNTNVCMFRFAVQPSLLSSALGNSRAAHIVCLFRLCCPTFIIKQCTGEQQGSAYRLFASLLFSSLHYAVHWGTAGQRISSVSLMLSSLHN